MRSRRLLGWFNRANQAALPEPEAHEDKHTDNTTAKEEAVEKDADNQETTVIEGKVIESSEDTEKASKENDVQFPETTEPSQGQPIIVAFYENGREVSAPYVFRGSVGDQLQLNDLNIPAGYEYVDGFMPLAISDDSQHLKIAVKSTLIHYVLHAVTEDGAAIPNVDNVYAQGEPGSSIPKSNYQEIDGYQPFEKRTYLVPEQDSDIEVVYHPVMQQIKVTAETDTGEVLTQEVLEGNTGEKYKINPQHYQIDGYELVKLPDNLSGEFTPGEQHISLIYHARESHVTVRFIDTHGKQIHRPLTYAGEFDSEQKVKLPIIDGYHLNDENSKEFTIHFEAFDSEKILKFERNEQEFAIHLWLDKAHKEKAAADIIVKGKVDDNYHEEVPEIKGYEVSEKVVSGQFSRYENPDIDITYQIKTSHLLVKFADAAGRPIKAVKPIEKLGHWGDEVTFDLPEIDGYERPKPTFHHQMESDDETIILHYHAKKVSVLIDYVNGQTNANLNLDLPKVKTGYVGQPYHVEPQPIDGYTLRDTPKNISGVFAPNMNKITLVYDPVMVTYVLNFIDLVGNAITEPKEVQGKYGTNYNFVQLAKKMAKGYQLQTLEQDLQGTFGKHNQRMNIRYQADEVSFTVVPVNQHEKPIDERYDLTIKGLMGQKFSTTLPKINGYQRKAERVGGTIGQDMVNKRVPVAYDPTTSKVTIRSRYQGGDHDGEAVFKDHIMTGLTGDSYHYNVPSVKGYTNDQVACDGNFAADPQTITINYSVTPEHYAVHFVDENRQMVGGLGEKDGFYGDIVEFGNAVPQGFHLPNGAKTSLQLSGKGLYQVVVIPDEILITLRPKATDGKDLGMSRQVKGKFHQPQEVQLPVISGYQAVDGQKAKLTFEFGQKEQVITYEPESRTIKVQYLDTQGNTIHPVKVYSGRFDEPYTITAPELEGYVVVGEKQKQGHYGDNGNAKQTETAFIYRAGSDVFSPAVTPLEDVMPGAESKADPRQLNVNELANRGPQVNVAAKEKSQTTFIVGSADNIVRQPETTVSERSNNAVKEKPHHVNNQKLARLQSAQRMMKHAPKEKDGD
ncbi:hypothetical protein FOD75_10815 (plasmid) [Limosilactobacillus reuteri]|uniref:MucBP domain-containing protein n=1 Tax=Limosilactobacillus reuteri TaxID=1598 RepID=A0A517D8A2_LIMRT|nr:MucBP domain-containing protein [Limosilactobacillus reuteri]QDR73582.1 hypothetical protein FOD75_10815 [Limosilactobacillus reuteri]